MSASFTPDFKGYTGQGAFRFWCQTALPLIYDDSLSYYELLNKVVVYLNNVISDVGNMEDNINALLSAYNQLQDYVNTYFDNVDVQEEINHKLDEMAEGGTLSTLIAPFVADGLPSVVGDQIDAVVAAQIDASVGSQIDESVASQIATPVATNVTSWLNENVTPVGSAVVVDESLSISGAAADAKVTGDKLKSLEVATNSLQLDEFVSYTPSYTLINDKQLRTDNTIVNANDFVITSVIPVKPLQIVEITGKANQSYISLLSLCDASGTLISSIGHGSTTNVGYIVRYMNKTNQTQYVRACSDTTHGVTVTIKNNVLYYDYSEKDCILMSRFYKLDETIVEHGTFVESTGLANDYVMTTPIKLNLGETICLYGTVSSSIPAIAKTNSLGSTYEALVSGINSATTYTYTAKEDIFIVLQFRDSSGYIISKSYNWNESKDFNDTRHATISFIFDDGNANDTAIATIFKNKGLKCGFALISTIQSNTTLCQTYLDLQKEGFSILSHSIDATGMNDATVSQSVISAKLLQSKQILVRRGFDIMGWVTPNSQMADVFKPLTKTFYSYAYTNYLGTYVPGGSDVPYNTYAEDTNELFRVDMYSQTDNIKAAIDETIAARGFMTVYFHGANWGDAYAARLEEVLDYVNTKIDTYQLKCLAPNEAFQYYYSVRKND